MKLKSDKLHFEIVSGSTKPSGYIRNSFREGGKVKHQTIARINGVPLASLQNMKAAFDGEAIKAGDIRVSDGREYGASNMLFELAKKIGLDKIIYSRFEKWVRCVLVMIIGRIIFQGSKLSLSKAGDYSCLWEICGIKGAVDVEEHCYAAMDELLDRQPLIQAKLAKKHLREGSVILYDITSTYLEGEYESSKFVDFGYNRDKKRGHKQLVVGLLCTKEGCPVGVEVFRGNTSDGSTVKGKVDLIKKKYGITNFVFVGDRGMLTHKNIEYCDDISTITALTHADMRSLVEEKNVQLSLFDEKTTTEVILPEEPGVRYGLRNNPVRAEKDRKTRTAIIEKTEELLAGIAAPKRKTSDDKLAAKVGKIFLKYKTEKYFSWSVADGKVSYSRRLDAIARDEKFDGLYVIRSSVPPEVMTISEVAQAYKSLINVEQAFRNMKTVQLEMRPIYHKTDDRIKAHVFICMLAYYLLWHMNRALLPLYERTGDSHEHVLNLLKSIQKSKLTVAGNTGFVVAEPNNSQQEILRLLSEAEA